LDNLKANLEKKYPGIKIVGTYAPEYAPDPKPPVIEAGSVDFFWVGLGNPKQEIWCYKHAKEIDAVCLLPVGAVFDFYSGTVPHAPDWIHKIGCRWLWRLLTGGKRTFKRNAWCVPRAAWILVTEFIRIRILCRKVASF
jgi:N-acetylglucosaminyldiphosphoundecaprenol N-acetyl-beta-D-mannosaminyltransferase